VGGEPKDIDYYPRVDHVFIEKIRHSNTINRILKATKGAPKTSFTPLKDSEWEEENEEELYTIHLLQVRYMKQHCW
jgi:hypothetical protein